VIDEFADLQIDQENEHDNEVEQPKLKSKIAAHEIVQLSTNRIPKGLVPLERLFDNNDVVVKLQSGEKESDVFQYNVASEQDPKHVNLASHLSKKQKADYGELLREFADIFAWQYDDLKIFDRSLDLSILCCCPQWREKLRNCWTPALSFLSGIQSGLLILCQSGRRMGRSDSASTSEI
jgi:hypothetical protein